jgi:hypothetical protein
MSAITPFFFLDCRPSQGTNNRPFTYRNYNLTVVEHVTRHRAPFRREHRSYELAKVEWAGKTHLNRPGELEVVVKFTFICSTNRAEAWPVPRSRRSDMIYNTSHDLYGGLTLNSGRNRKRGRTVPNTFLVAYSLRFELNIAFYF